MNGIWCVFASCYIFQLFQHICKMLPIIWSICNCVFIININGHALIKTVDGSIEYIIAGYARNGTNTYSMITDNVLRINIIEHFNTTHHISQWFPHLYSSLTQWPLRALHYFMEYFFCVQNFRLPWNNDTRVYTKQSRPTISSYIIS